MTEHALNNVRVNEKFSGKFFFNDDRKVMLVNYQCRQKKNVHLMSTMHVSLAVYTTEKKKPLAIHFYNHKKVGLDVFDQMFRLYTTHAAIRRWPMAVWTNILDMACLNSWILFKKATGSRNNRCAFILQLFEELTSAYVSNNKKCKLNEPEEDYQRPSGKRLKCVSKQFKNNTVTICQCCRKPARRKCGTGNSKLTECKECISQES